MIHITVERLSDNDLKRQSWLFWFDDSRSVLVLDEYRAETRHSKRHKWQSLSVFRRTDKRRNTTTVDDVPLPDDVEAQALKQFIAQVKVVKEI